MPHPYNLFDHWFRTIECWDFGFSVVTLIGCYQIIFSLRIGGRVDIIKFRSHHQTWAKYAFCSAYFTHAFTFFAFIPILDYFLCRNQQADLNTLRGLREQNSVWALFSDGSIWNGSVKQAHLDTPVEEGDVIGLYYDHAELTFAVNGIPVKLRLAPTSSNAEEPQPVVFQNGLIGIRGTVFPVFATDDGAILDTRFTSFYYPPSRNSGFAEIRLEQDII
ncbi:unnamed protein product [Dibothriocephalus latus]|uniref:Uncharacterized protein n=1 Tax=Dibothriocephalus latus TaxID=60516 RepID=A0A3P7R4L8_DIBLA|nr:unnamed protein product [Dibothriocephalus latus]